VLGSTRNPAAAPPLVRLASKPVKDARVVIPIATEHALQVAALVAAARLANPAVHDAVLPLMKHAEVPVREAATFAIGRMADRRAVAPLIAALGDRTASIATLGCLGLVRQRDRRVAPALVEVVGNKLRHPSVRAACAYAIGVHRITAAVPTLTRALEDSGDVLRLSAWSLGEMGPPAATAPLLEVYFANAGRDRRELEYAIARTTGAPAASTALVDLAEYPRKDERYDPAPTIARLPGELPTLHISDAVLPAHAHDIARAISNGLASPEVSVVVALLAELDGEDGRIGFGVLTPRTLDGPAATAIASISSAIEPALPPLLAHYDPLVRTRTLSVLTKAAGPRAEAGIAATLSDPDPSVRAAAMAAIGQLARRHPVPSALVWRLTRALGSTVWQDRIAAARAMGELGTAADIPALAAAARDDSIFVREAVATALGAIGTTATVVPLLELSRDEVPAVRGAAARALRPLSDPRARQRVNELLADPALAAPADAKRN
jgi:HEAT repeat protein